MGFWGGNGVRVQRPRLRLGVPAGPDGLWVLSMVRVGGGVPNRAGAGGQGRAGPRALSAPPSLVTIFLAAIQPRLLAASGALALQRARYPAAPRRLGPRLRSAPPARLCRSSRGGPQVPAAPALAPRRWTTTPGMPWTRGGVSHKAARGSAPPGPGAADPRSRRPAEPQTRRRRPTSLRILARQLARGREQLRAPGACRPCDSYSQ